MAKKGKKPQDQISDLAKRINDTIARWKTITTTGAMTQLIRIKQLSWWFTKISVKNYTTY